jgi:hypothetical protein
MEKTTKFAGLITVRTSSVSFYNTRHGKEERTCFNMCECSAEKGKGLLYASDDQVKMCEASRKWHAHILSETQDVKTQVMFVSADTALQIANWTKQLLKYSMLSTKKCCTAWVKGDHVGKY